METRSVALIVDDEFLIRSMAVAVIPDIHAQVMDTEDAREGIRSFVERREARFQGR